MSGASDVLVVGGGIAGLACAWRLHSAGMDVRLIERAPQAGGALRSVCEAGHVIECGPNTVLGSSAHVLKLIEELGLEPSLVPSREEAERRFIWRAGRLHELPKGPRDAFKTRLLSWRGKLRILSEPLQPAKGDSRPETLGSMMRRRLGPEAVQAVLDPFVAGIYAGSADDLGSDAFPKLVELEQEHGSLLRGMIALRRERGSKKAAPKPSARSRMITLEGGLARIAGTIAERLGDRITLGRQVTRVAPTSASTSASTATSTSGGGAGADAGWKVTVAGSRAVTARHLVMATPAWVTAKLLESVDEGAAALLADIPFPHVASVALGYRRDQIGHDLEGFGFLIAADSPLPGAAPVLGVLFVSTIFAGRAPEGEVQLVVMIGGSRAPEARVASDDVIRGWARRAAEEVLGARGEPTLARVSRWHRAIPQYRPGHRARIAELRERLAGHAGLHLVGSHLDGVGLDAAAGTGLELAEALVEALSAG